MLTFLNLYDEGMTYLQSLNYALGHKYSIFDVLTCGLLQRRLLVFNCMYAESKFVRRRHRLFLQCYEPLFPSEKPHNFC